MSPHEHLIENAIIWVKNKKLNQDFKYSSEYLNNIKNLEPSQTIEPDVLLDIANYILYSYTPYCIDEYLEQAIKKEEIYFSDWNKQKQYLKRKD